MSHCATDGFKRNGVITSPYIKHHHDTVTKAYILYESYLIVARISDFASVI